MARTFLGICVIVAGAAVLEAILERRDKARLTTSDTFCAVGGRQVRYRLMGAGMAGPTIVLIPGLFAYLEQWSDVQYALSQAAPVLTYDRAGMGFSDAIQSHDAESEAEELAAVLHASGTPPVYLVVSYSASAFVARIFAARYPDTVKGQVFIDPMDSRADMPRTYRRILGRTTVPTTAKALVGYLRLRQWLDRRRAPANAIAEKEFAILESAHFWLALTADAFDFDHSADEARGAPQLGSVPTGVMSTVDMPENSSWRVDQRALAANSFRGTFRSLHGVDHTKVLSDKAGVEAVVGLIRDVYEEAR